MPALANSLAPCRGHYTPPLPGHGPARELGHAFQHAWHDRSEVAACDLREAIATLVTRLKEQNLPLEEAVVAFKTAIRLHGGLHAYPSLVAEEHGADGDECAATYARAFSTFVEIYFRG